MTLELRAPLAAVPPSLAQFPLTLADDGCKLIYTYDTRSEHTGITDLLDALRTADVRFKDLATTQTSLEDIFVSLLRNGA
jgi:ABC-2 type transport system ATP-binding protein